MTGLLRSGAFESSLLDDMTYKIIKFEFGKFRRTIKTGLTIEEAREYCNRDDTRGDGWFYGFTKE